MICGSASFKVFDSSCDTWPLSSVRMPQVPSEPKVGRLLLRTTESSSRALESALVLGCLMASKLFFKLFWISFLLTVSEKICCTFIKG